MALTILKDRIVVRITGEDRFKFLQGLITNDINKLETNNSIYACFLTPQGKYFTDLFLVKEGESILVDLPFLRIDEILGKLNIYKLRNKVNFENCPEYKVISLLDQEEIPGIIFSDPRSDRLGKRGYILNSNLTNLQDDKLAYDIIRIQNFIAEGEKDLISEQAFIQEYDFDNLNAIDYKKGCYVGQEIIARTHYKGEIRKRIVQVECKTSLPPHGTIIFAKEKKLGIICSSVDNFGLALIRIEEMNDLEKSVKITADSQEIKLKFKEH